MEVAKVIASIMQSTVYIIAITAMLAAWYILISQPANCPQCGGNLDIKPEGPRVFKNAK